MLLYRDLLLARCCSLRPIVPIDFIMLLLRKPSSCHFILIFILISILLGIFIICHVLKCGPLYLYIYTNLYIYIYISVFYCTLFSCLIKSKWKYDYCGWKIGYIHISSLISLPFGLTFLPPISLSVYSHLVGALVLPPLCFWLFRWRLMLRYTLAFTFRIRLVELIEFFGFTAIDCRSGLPCCTHCVVDFNWNFILYLNFKISFRTGKWTICVCGNWLANIGRLLANCLEELD